MYQGKVISIHISPSAGQPMHSILQVQAIANLGLEGDRYTLAAGTYSKKPDPGRQVTLIEVEAIDALRGELGIQLDPGDVRRNLVTTGVPLNHLVGRQFQVGEIILQGIRLCEPCDHLASLTEAGILPGLVHRGGLRAQILSGGLIHVGDEILAQ